MDISPNLNQFKKLSLKHNLIVLSHKFYSDSLTPVSLYYNIRKYFKGESFLLESVEGEEKISRFSFLGFCPLQIFKSKGKNICLDGLYNKKFKTDKDPIHELKKIMRLFKAAPMENLRFFGGFVGYAGYDIVRFYESIGKDLADPVNDYDTYFILPKFLVIFDHLKRQIEILSFIPINKAKAKNIYLKEKRGLTKVIRKITSCQKLNDLSFEKKSIKITSNFSKKDFFNAVKKIKTYIKQGEIIQAVLSQRFCAQFNGDSFTVYRYLRILNPSPYMFYLNFGEVKIVGSSPEMLLRCEGGELVTRPIAGTRPRGKTEAEDLELEKSLLNDPKEIAEHIMLVDLARNDLGRVAEKASVNLPKFMTVERFSHVMHIVSEVKARLAKTEDIFSSLISCFPAGTLSGAPKVRAMQIINELEPISRGIYGGAVGYFSLTNSLDTCIIIRTIVFKEGEAYIQAGAGIVNDSVPLKEYNETINKAKAQITALELA